MPGWTASSPPAENPWSWWNAAWPGRWPMHYPRKQVWLLDDAARPELELLCLRLGCRYRSRAGRRHAKAGNLNAALPHLEGDLVAVFDADVVPLTSFLRRTVGLFTDPRVGFVQTPQCYMNADPLLRNGRLERWLLPDERASTAGSSPPAQSPGRRGLRRHFLRDAAFRPRGGGGLRDGNPPEDLATGIASPPRATATSTSPKSSAPALLPSPLRPSCASAAAGQRHPPAPDHRANPPHDPGLTPSPALAYLEVCCTGSARVPQLLWVLLPLSLAGSPGAPAGHGQRIAQPTPCPSSWPSCC